MLYECLVIDNSNFFKNGTIRVRIKREVSSAAMMRDLSINPVQSINDYGNQRYEKYGNDIEFKYDDEDVRVSTSIGGAYDYGVFILPQPNTWGLVAETCDFYDDRSTPKMIWIGSIAMFNMKTNDIAIPSDNNIKNGCNNGEINLEDPYSSLVFKQKETHISNSSEKIIDKSKETLDWELRPTQNMIVINNNRIFVSHNNYDDDGKYIGTSKIEMNKNGASISYSDPDNIKNSKLELKNNNSFSLTSENIDEKKLNIIDANEEGITINRLDNKDSISFFMGDNNGIPSCSISLSPEGDSIPTEIKMEKRNGITINSNGNISINPGENSDITLGTGEGYILTSPSPGTFNFDNHPITAVRNAKA